MTVIDIYSGFLGAGKTTLIKKMISEAFAGQKLIPSTLAKIARLRKMLDCSPSWDSIGQMGLLEEGHAIGAAELLFTKVEDDQIEAQLAKLAAAKAEHLAAEAAAVPVEPQKEEVTFEQFQAMDIRTATVLEAEKVPKTDKLLKLTIDTGIDKRTIVSGIAQYYSPEDMVGKQICILANLKPRMIKGIESKGMILMASQKDGKMRFITPQEVVNNGSQVG